MVRHNNAIPNGHFHKDWQRYVKINFDQPFKKIRRNAQRQKKLRLKAPRPLDSLRPIVHCPSARYNSKVRIGRGFTLQELKAAKIHPSMARSVGISVDYRRHNKCFESIFVNVQRLKNYYSKLIIFPKQTKKREAIGAVKTVDKGVNKLTKPVKQIKAIVPTAEEKKFEAYVTLRKARKESMFLSRKVKRDKIKAEINERK